MTETDIKIEPGQRRELLEAMGTMLVEGKMDVKKLIPAISHLPRFQQAILSRLLAAEGHENNKLFAAFEKVTDDPDLREKLRRHAKDEARHARMIKALMDELGYAPMDADDGYLDILSRVGQSNDEDDLVGFLAALVNIEKKAIMILQILVEQFEEGHPIHRTMSEILVDEERHIAWVSEYLEEKAKNDPEVRKAVERLNAADAYAEVTLKALGPIGYVNRLVALGKLMDHLPTEKARKVLKGELKNMTQEPLNGDTRIREILKQMVTNRMQELGLKKAKAA